MYFKKMYFKKLICLPAILIVNLALINASELSIEETLKGKITQTLEQLLASEANGVQNCENKCEKAYNRLAYQISAADGRRTYEFQACVRGCNQCQQDLQNPNASKSNCFDTCKNFDWKGNGIVKGVIEPDKACIGGCIIQTCQVICEGGTVDPPNKSNRKLFWPNGGCSIKTEPYSQYIDYVPWNSPAGAGADNAVKLCCSNAMSLCDYFGDTNSQNYQQLLANTGKYCQNFAGGTTVEDICNFFQDPQICGGTVPT